MKARGLALRLHRWGGITAGLVVWLLCLTGAVLIVALPAGLRSLHLTDPIAPGDGDPLPASALIAAALSELPGAEAASIELHRDPTRAAVLQLRNGSTVFLDPWSGRVVSARDPGGGSAVLTGLHTRLALGDPGRGLVIAGTIAFVPIASLGLWLWWPAKRRFRRALTIRTNRGLKRLNYDLHNVLGFYAALLLLILSGTGILMAFPRLMDTGARAAAVVLPEPKGLAVPEQDTAETAAGEDAMGADVPLVDRALAHGDRLFPEAPWRRAIALPVDPPRFRVLVAASERFDRTHTVRVDAEGGLIGVVEYGEERIALQFSRWVNQLHTGRLGNGYPVLALLACVIGTILPPTGALIWFPRWRRSGRRARPDEAG